MQNKKFGFTVVEIIVVISIIGMLSSITLVSYRGWSQKTIIVKQKNDLQNALTAMESYRNFHNEYPVDISMLTSFSASDGIVVTGGSPDGAAYCINATSATDTTIKHSVSSANATKEPIEGECL